MQVCLITDRGVLPEPALIPRVQAAVAAGISMVQVRDKALVTASLVDLTRRLLAALRDGQGASVPVLINGRLDVALAVGAAGVHLPGNGLPVARVRRLAPPPFLVGVSAHSPEDLRRAEGEGADYAFFGPVFPTASHPGAPGIGPQGVRRALESCRLPLWAIGGIDPRTALRLAGLGLAGVAAIRSLLLGQDIRAVVAALRAVPTSPSSPE